MWKLVLAILIGALAILDGVAIAQQAQNSGAPPASKESGAQPNQAEPQVLQVPHQSQLLILIRSTVLAVNQANLTGNYSVLRDLGTPGFQQSNNPTRLADIFKVIRDRNIDLGPIAILEAKLSQQPSINANGQLRLTGFFPSRPEQVNFDLAFYKRNGRWLLHGIALNTTRKQAIAPASSKNTSASSSSE